MRKESVNTWSGGLMMDLNPISTPNTVLTDCINGTFVTYSGNELVLQNDRGNYRLKGSELSENFMPVGIASYGDILYVISYNPLTEESEIGSFPSPNNSVSMDTGESILIESLLEQAFKYDPNGTWTKEQLERDYGKTFVFYGIGENNMLINPGDSYKISDVPNTCDYERLRYKIFNTDANDIEVQADDEYHTVSWEMSGHLQCQFSLPSVTNIRTDVLTLDVPWKYQDATDGKWKLEEKSISSQIALSFETDDKLLQTAYENGDIYVVWSASAGKVKSEGKVTSFSRNEYPDTVSYSTKESFELPFSIDEATGKATYNEVQVTASCYLRVYNSDYSKKNVVLLGSAPVLTIDVSEARERVTSSVANSLFQYTYTEDTKNLLTNFNLLLTGTVTKNFRIDGELIRMDDNGEVEVIAHEENLYPYYYNNLQQIRYNWEVPTEDFYALRLKVLEVVEGEETIIGEPVTRFIIADECMNKFNAVNIDGTPLYPMFDSILGDEVFADLKWEGKDTYYYPSPSVSSYAYPLLVGDNEEFQHYLNEKNNDPFDLVLDTDLKDTTIHVTRKTNVITTAEFGYIPTPSYTIFKNRYVDPIADLERRCESTQTQVVDVTILSTKDTTLYKNESGELYSMTKRYQDGRLGPGTLRFSRPAPNEYDPTITDKNGKKENHPNRKFNKLAFPNQHDFHYDLHEDSTESTFNDDYFYPTIQEKGALTLVDVELTCDERSDSDLTKFDRMVFGDSKAIEDNHRYAKYNYIVGEQDDHHLLWTPIFTEANLGLEKEDNRVQLDRLLWINPKSDEPVSGYYVPANNDGIPMVSFTEHDPESMAIHVFDDELTVDYNDGFRLLNHASTFNPAFVAAIQNTLLEGKECSNLYLDKVHFAVQFDYEVDPIKTGIKYTSIKERIANNITYFMAFEKQYSWGGNCTTVYNIYPKPDSYFFDTYHYEFDDQHVSAMESQRNDLFSGIEYQENPVEAKYRTNWGKVVRPKGDVPRFMDIALNEDYQSVGHLQNVLVFLRPSRYESKPKDASPVNDPLFADALYLNCPASIKTDLNWDRYNPKKDESFATVKTAQLPDGEYFERYSIEHAACIAAAQNKPVFLFIVNKRFSPPQENIGVLSCDLICIVPQKWINENPQRKAGIDLYKNDAYSGWYYLHVINLPTNTPLLCKGEKATIGTHVHNQEWYDYMNYGAAKEVDHWPTGNTIYTTYAIISGNGLDKHSLLTAESVQINNTEEAWQEAITSMYSLYTNHYRNNIPSIICD